MRIARFVRALRSLVESIIGTMRSLCWAVVLLLLIIYIFAVIFTQAVADHTQVESALNTFSDTDLWGGLPSSMLTLFGSVTSGVDWIDAMLSIGECGPVWAVLFVFYICFTSLAVMNVLTGSFCQSAIEGAEIDKDLLIQHQLNNRNKFHTKIRAIFETIDKSGLGIITIRDLEEHLNNPKVQAYFSALELDTQDAMSFFKLLDSNGSQCVDCDDFVLGCMRLKGTAKALHLAQLIHETKKTRQRLTSFMQLVARLMNELTGGDVCPQSNLLDSSLETAIFWQRASWNSMGSVSSYGRRDVSTFPKSVPEVPETEPEDMISV